MKRKKLKIILLILFATCLTYREALLECTKLKLEDRNICRQQVTERYRYVEEEPVEINIFTIKEKRLKEVGDFKEIFKDDF